MFARGSFSNAAAAERICNGLGTLGKGGGLERADRKRGVCMEVDTADGYSLHAACVERVSGCGQRR